MVSDQKRIRRNAVQLQKNTEFYFSFFFFAGEILHLKWDLICIGNVSEV